MSATPKKQNASLIRPRVYLGDGVSIGPGKIELLRAIAETHSITAAAKALHIPYKRAWILIDSLNQGFGHPVVETAAGGKGGGGSRLTTLGEQLVACYRALEERINSAAAEELAAIQALASA
jgi:molybdate transport system regulatory protein